MTTKIPSILSGTPFENLPEHIQDPITGFHAAILEIASGRFKPSAADYSAKEKIDPSDASTIGGCLDRIYEIQFTIWSRFHRLPHELLADVWFMKVMNAPPYYALQARPQVTTSNSPENSVSPEDVPHIERNVLFAADPPSMNFLKGICRGRASKKQIRELREALVEASVQCRLLRDTLAKVSDELDVNIPKAERTCLVFQFYLNMIVCLMNGVDFTGQYLLRNESMLDGHALH